MANNESIVQALKAAISQLESEKLRIDGQIEALKDVLPYFETQGSSAQAPVNVSSSANPPQTDLGGLNAGLRRSNAIAAILKATSPLSRQDIYKQLVEKGVHIGGQNPLASVSTYLSIDPRFINVGRGMWRLAQPHDESSDDGDDGNDYEDDTEEEDNVPW